MNSAKSRDRKLTGASARDKSSKRSAGKTEAKPRRIIPAAPGKRKRGRPQSSHEIIELPIGVLPLKPTLYPEHQQFLAAMRNPPSGMSRKQYIVYLAVRALRGQFAQTDAQNTADSVQFTSTEDADLQAFIDV